MKRILTLTLALALTLGLVACGTSNDSSSDTTVTPDVEDSAPAVDEDMGVDTDMGVDPDMGVDDDMGVTPEGDASANLYANIIVEARSAEENEYYMVVFPSADGYGAIEGYSADYEPEYLTEDVTNFMAPMLGFDVSLAEDFAFSLSTMMTQSYCIAIVNPADGNTDAIVEGLESFVAQQRNSFQNYLPDQYEIANAATVTVADSGEVILVCGANGADILANIETALKG